MAVADRQALFLIKDRHSPITARLPQGSLNNAQPLAQIVIVREVVPNRFKVPLTAERDGCELNEQGKDIIPFGNPHESRSVEIAF